ncbi:MAG: caspase family protein, partial [Alphaproteobacteria bacterium]|nr:caspase family protein [Alphaproteobacteria bacterium]
YFSDYVHRAFGVPRSNIQLLIDKDANRLSMKRAIKRWLPGLIRKDKTDVYVFFAGHGLASRDGKDLYLLPENGLPDLLEDSAIMRSEIYDVLTEASPRSVIVFLDTCFSGGTRGNAMLVADARNILVTARDSLTPDRFTVFTASAGDEISSSLPEAEHGLFSYFLMKGMEGEADYNADKRITVGELHAYVLDHVSRQALRLGRVQTPQLQGDGDRVLVKW